MKALLHFVISFLLLLITSWANPDAGETYLFRRNSTGLTEVVAWDPQSLSILGQRVFVLSAEIHPWRLPGNPHLWADLFQKVKDNGFNCVSACLSWALHYPSPDTNNGKGDFQAGTYRDLQMFIDAIQDAGLWMIARPGPYINGETTGGGFPGWVENIAGSLRTDNDNYTAAWTTYVNVIAQLIAKNQITEGGPIILVQSENEFSPSAVNSPYMQDIINTFRANGIVIPITANDKNSGEDGNFSPDLPGPGQVNIYCGDSYPQGANSWAQVQSIYYTFHEAVAYSNPLCLAELGGGFLLNWGEEPLGGTGYEKYSADLTDADYENVFYKDAYAQTARIVNIYMVYGGTNWGQTAAPVSYTSYDYGGGIDENRVAGPKMNEMRLQGLFLRVSRDLFGSIPIGNGTNYTTSVLTNTYHSQNLDTGVGFYFLRQTNSTSTALTSTRLIVDTSQGTLTIPQFGGEITFDGRENKILVTDYAFGASGTVILYTTAEIMTWSTIGVTDYIILYALPGQTGETVFLFDNEPIVDLSDAPYINSTFFDQKLILQYTLDGSQFIPIKQWDNLSLVVIIMDKTVANRWHAPVIPSGGLFGNSFSIGSNETVLVGGPYVVRNATISGDILSLIGDLNGTTAIEIVAPPTVTGVLWNGATIKTSVSSQRTLTSNITVEHPALTLPTFDNWKVSGSAPEIFSDFDDSNFTVADQTQTNYTNLPPLAGSQVLYAQQYGFYGGNLIFRGRFNATGEEIAVNLTVQYGFAGGYSTWLNGIFLGSSQGNSTVSLSTNVWTFPDGALVSGAENVVVVIQDHMGNTETSTNSGKEPRGIRGYALIGGNSTFSSWMLQGNQGGAAGAPDTFRGYLNEGGLYAERIGAHLPGYPDDDWTTGSPLTGLSQAGINFYRTTFDLRIPDGFDVPVRLSFTPSVITSNYRVQIYLNGWQIGKFINNIGPQTIFVLPAGILLRDSANTLALSLWSLDATSASVAGLELIFDGTFATALRFVDYEAPDFSKQAPLRPAGILQTPF